MTEDTTFKEFLAERDISLAQLAYNSEEYRELARQFNEAKLQLAEAKPEAAELARTSEEDL
jgi:hypothetical protein